MTLQEREQDLFFPTYKRIPLAIGRGEGVYLFDTAGRKYLDLFSGLGVNALGHNHPRIIDAIERQSRRYIHASNFYLQEPQIELAERLISASGYSKVFLTNSGTEAIEAALKIARRWGNVRKKTTICSFSNAFHGRTMGALSSMDREKYRVGFEPFLPGFVSIPYNDPEALRTAINDDTAAVLLEFIQGEGGIIPATEEFVAELIDLRQRYEFLVIADEIQSGLARTGKLFAFEYYPIRPDILALAKALGGGLPLGAVLGTASLADVLEPGAHGTTFGGNPVACAAGIIVLDEIAHGGLIPHVQHVGEFFFRSLLELRNEFPMLVLEVRGKGLMLGIQLGLPGETVVDRMCEAGVLINCTAETVLRFLPPLIINKDELAVGVETLREVLRTMQR